MKRVGKWIILGESGRSEDGHLLYKAKCSVCGCVRISKMWNIERDKFSAVCKHFTGIRWPSPRLYQIYKKMLDRCCNQKAKDYRFYGAKGIMVCDEWKGDKQAFISWAVSNGYNDTKSIDRINPKKEYSPKNCRWISIAENSKYKSTTRCLTIDGITDSLSGWAKRLNIPKTTIVGGVRGKTDAEAIKYIQKHSGVVQ